MCIRDRLKRYVIQSRSRVPLETPQEMFLGIALHLAMNEGSDRMLSLIHISSMSRSAP